MYIQQLYPLFYWPNIILDEGGPNWGKSFIPCPSNSSLSFIVV